MNTSFHWCGFLGLIGLLMVTGCQPRDNGEDGKGNVLPPPEAPRAGWSLARVDGGEPLTPEAMTAGQMAVLYYFAPWADTGTASEAVMAELSGNIRVYPVAVDRAGTDPLPATLAGQPVLRGDARAVAAFGGIRAMPTAILLDAQGQPIRIFAGHVPATEILAAAGL
jgi:hypothetical protein